MSPITGSGKKRNTYTVDEKLDVIKLVDQQRALKKDESVAIVSRDTGILPKLIYDWISVREQLAESKNKAARRRLSAGPRRSKFEALEEKMLAWVLQCREKKSIVTYNSFKRQAKHINNYNSHPEFRCSNSFVKAFMRRHNLSYRRPTHKAQQNNKKPEVKCQEAAVYINKLNQYSQEYIPSLIMNMDETPVYFDQLENATMAPVGSCR